MPQSNTPNSHENPLGAVPINTLLARFAIPSIIATLVSALYNIVDQFFIGRSVLACWENAATNVAFPLTITCTAISLMCGIGGAANFNLSWAGVRKRRPPAMPEMPSSCFFPSACSSALPCGSSSILSWCCSEPLQMCWTTP